MAKLIAPNSIISRKAKLEFPVRVFAYASVQAGAEIGGYSYINRYAFISGGVRMGRYCSVARGADIGALTHPTNLLSTHTFQYSKLHFEDAPGYLDFDRTIELPKEITRIGHDVWFGAKTIISAGVTIGTGAIIGENSFVNQDIPPYAIAVGSPARILRYRFEPDVITKLLASDWWDLEPAEMEGVDFDQIDLALEQIATRLAAKRAGQNVVVGGRPQEDTPFIVGLRQALFEVDIPEEIADLALADAHLIAEKFDPLDPGDLEILRNKLAYLAEFLSERDAKSLSRNEKQHIRNLFRSKQ